MSEMAAPPGETGGHNLESPVAGQIEDSTSCERLEDTDLIRSYIGHGFALVPIPKGQKGPTTSGWNRPENCITTPGELHKLHNKNIGLAHAYSGTCALDIDDFSEAEQWFASHSIDLVQHCMSAVQVSSGRQNHAKLIFKFPLGLESLPSVKIRGKKSDAVDFRCGTANGTTVQDLLPPSIHPDTGESYKWVNGDHTNIPVLPDEILEIWKRLLEEKQSTTLDTTDIKAPAEWKHVSLEALNLPAHTQHLIKHGDTQANAYHGDRSEAVYGATKDLICAGATDHQILCVLTDPEYGISEKPLDRGIGDFHAACRWLMPQLAKARAEIDAESTSLGMSFVSAPDLTFTLLDPYENPADIPEREYVLDGTFKILSPTVGVIAATAGCAKSTMACTIAVSAATGIPLLGVTVKKPASVGVIEGEDDVIHMRGQFAAICQHHNITPDKLQNRLFYISGAEKKPVFGVKDPITKQIITTDFAQYVHDFIAQNNLKILFAGPLSTLVRGWDDKSNADMQEVLDLFGVIAAQTRCTIILTHHVTKSGMKGGYDPEYYAGNPEAIRGGSALVGAVRSAFTLCRMNDSSAKDYGITDVTEQNRHIRLDNAKANYSLLSGTPTWFRLASVSIPNGDEYGVLEQAEFSN
ncbi:MAG: AAA family ATPase, partial [Candidatus Thiodiazotropha taylori]|nr:AAA family ATPase [Candidatus Thiodiazotropha taylori]MCW4327882.1 AAA family ATPase [Candidatus Thiodiazotropha taylori]